MAVVDTILIKRDLMDDVERSVLMSRYMDAWVDSITGKTKKENAKYSVLPSPNALADHLKSYEKLRSAMLTWLGVSENFYVSQEMMDVLIAATVSVPEDVSLTATDLPSPFGWVKLASPLTLLDIRSRPLRFHACSWAQIGSRVQIIWYTDKYDRQDSTNPTKEEMLKALPRWTPSHSVVIPFGETFPVSPQLRSKDGSIITPEHKLEIRHDDSGFAVRVAGDTDGFDMVDGPSVDLQFLYAFFRILKQKIVTKRQETEFPRNVRREFQRKNVNLQITVIEFRKSAVRGDGSSTVDWSHRWLCRGHWRKQWYGSGDDRYWEFIWIHPHIKGPEDKPLLMRDHVNALVR